MNPSPTNWKAARRLQAWHLKQQGWSQRQIAEAHNLKYLDRSWLMHQSARIAESCVCIALPVLFLSFSVPISANCGEATPAQGPVVREPVSPKSRDAPVQELTPAPQWKPGDPVQVRPDLKSSSQPRVSDPVTPKVKEESLEEAPTATPPDAPVRVMPDLRETPSPPNRKPTP
jgi:hypothetical protein